MTERNKTLALVGGLVLVLATAGMLLLAELVGGPDDDVDRFMLFVAGFAVPTITTLLASAGVRAELSGKIDEVRANTNGKLDRVTQENEQLRQLLAEAERRELRQITAAIGNGSHQPAVDETPTEPIPTPLWPTTAAVRPHEDEGTKK